MSDTPAPIVLAISDVGLRTVLMARLGMAGEMPILTTDHRDPTMDSALRQSALLIIEAASIGSEPDKWSEALRGEQWSGRIVIIVDEPPGHFGYDNDINLATRRHADVAILALLQLWQAR